MLSPRFIAGRTGTSTHTTPRPGPVGLLCRSKHASLCESPPDPSKSLPALLSNSAQIDAMLIGADASLIGVERSYLGREDGMFMFSHYKASHQHKNGGNGSTKLATNTTPSSSRQPPQGGTANQKGGGGTPAISPRLPPLGTSSSSPSSHRHSASRIRAETKLSTLLATKDAADATARGSARARKKTRDNIEMCSDATTDKRAMISSTSSQPAGGTKTTSTLNITGPKRSILAAPADFNSDDSEAFTTDQDKDNQGVSVSACCAVPRELLLQQAPGTTTLKPMPTKQATDIYNQSAAVVTTLWEQFDAKLLSFPPSPSSFITPPAISAQVPGRSSLVDPPEFGASTNPSPVVEQQQQEGTNGGGEGDGSVMEEEDLIDWLILESVLEKAGVTELYAALDGVEDATASSSTHRRSNKKGGGLMLKTFHYDGPRVRGVLATRRIQLLQRLWGATRDSALVGM